MSILQLKADLQTAIQQAEHKPGEWSQTAQSMGGICCPSEPFQIGKPWAKEEPWAQFSYKRDSWLAVAAVNALPTLLAEIQAPTKGRVPAGLYRELAALRELRDLAKKYFDSYLLDEVEDAELCVSEDQHLCASALSECLMDAFEAHWDSAMSIAAQNTPEAQ